MIPLWAYREIQNDLKHFGLEGHEYDIYHVIPTNKGFDSIISMEQWHSCMPIAIDM